MRKLKPLMITVTMVCIMSFVGCTSKDKKESVKSSPSSSPTASSTAENEQPTASSTAENEQPTASSTAENEQPTAPSTAKNKTDTKANKSNNKQTNKNEISNDSVPAAGTYIRKWKNDSDGEIKTYKDYLILNKDGSGYIISLPVARIKWNNSTISTSCETFKYKYKANSKMIVFNCEGIEMQFVFESSSITNDAKKRVQLAIDNNYMN